MTDFSTGSPRALWARLPVWLRWLACQQALHGSSVSPTDRRVYPVPAKVNGCQAKRKKKAELLGTGLSKEQNSEFHRMESQQGWPMLCPRSGPFFRSWVVYFSKGRKPDSNKPVIASIILCLSEGWLREKEYSVLRFQSPGYTFRPMIDLAYMAQSVSDVSIWNLCSVQ